ncbi:MAG: cation diffusion facilitator family transporter [Planctomycetota bacterium]
MSAHHAGQRSLTAAVVVAGALAVVKFAVGLLSGSLIVLASAADSFADTLMSAVNLWGYRHARTPADEEHPYGHGKIEGVLSAAQGMLLVGVVGSLVAASTAALTSGERQAPRVALGIVAIVVSGCVSFALSWILTHTPDEGRSVVVESDAAHYRVDFLTALAGVGGLLAVELTGLSWIDPAASLVMAAFMGIEAARVLRNAKAELLDEVLPEEEQALLEAVLERNRERVVAFHGLRTRRSGPLRFVEVHAVLPGTLSLADAHILTQGIGAELSAALPSCRVLVHPDAEGLYDRVDAPLEGPDRE